MSENAGNSVATLLIGCAIAFYIGRITAPDDNEKPVYGKESGLSVNCRAYVQAVINGFESGEYSPEDSFIGLERNCGINGLAWKDNR